MLLLTARHHEAVRGLTLTLLFIEKMWTGIMAQYNLGLLLIPKSQVPCDQTNRDVNIRGNQLLGVFCASEQEFYHADVCSAASFSFIQQTQTEVHALMCVNK